MQDFLRRLGDNQDTPATSPTGRNSIFGLLKGVFSYLSSFIIVKGLSSKSSVSHTRPNNATAYEIGDVVGTDPATNLVFENVAAAGASFIITNLVLRIDVSSIPSGMSSFRLHLYNAAPTAIADNSAYNLLSGDRSKYLDYIDIDVPNDFGDTLFVSIKNINLQLKLANGSTTLYGMLETRGAYTPTALAVKTVILYTVEV